MNQELEQRVNQLVLENNGMSHAEALAQAQREAGQEEAEGVIEATEDEVKKKDSGYWAGQFQFVGALEAPSFDLAEPRSGVTFADRNLAKYSVIGQTPEQIAQRRYNQEVESYNKAVNEYQSQFSEYEDAFPEYQDKLNKELDKLNKQAINLEDPEERAALYAGFSEATGYQFEEDALADYEANIVYTIEYNSALDKAFEDEDFSPIEDFLVQNGREDEVAAQKIDFATQLPIIKARESSLKDAMISSYTVEQFSETLEANKLSPENPSGFTDEQIEEYKSFYEAHKNNLDASNFDPLLSQTTEIEEKLKLLQEAITYNRILPAEGERISFESLSDEVRTQLEAALGEAYDVLRGQRNERSQRIQEIFNEYQDNETVKQALSFMRVDIQKIIAALPENSRAAFEESEGKMQLWEAAWMESEEKAQAERDAEAALAAPVSNFALAASQGRIESNQLNANSVFESAKNAFKREFENKTTATHRATLQSLMEGASEDDVMALETAIRLISGKSIDINGDGGKIGYGSENQQYFQSLSQVPILTPAQQLIASVFGSSELLSDVTASFFAGGADLATDVAWGLGALGINVDSILDSMHHSVESEDDLAALDFVNELRLTKWEDLTNLDFLGSVSEMSAHYESAAIESIRQGNYEAGFKQLARSAAGSLPITLATIAVSTVTGGAGGYLFASLLSTGMKYQEVYDDENFKNMSALERNAYITLHGAGEGLSEWVGAGVTGRLLSRNILKRLSTETLSQAGKRIGKTLGVEYLTDASTEMATEGWQMSLDVAFDPEASFEGAGDRILEAGAISFLTSGGMTVAGSVNSSFTASSDASVITTFNDLTKRINEIMDSTAPGSKVRADMINMLVEDSGLVAQLNLDTFELHEFIRKTSNEDMAQLTANSRKLNLLMNKLQNATSASDIKSLKQQIQEVISDNRSIEQKHVDGFVQRQESSQDKRDRLEKRRKNLQRQANRKANQGKEAVAQDIKRRIANLDERIAVIDRTMYVESQIGTNQIISSENQDISKLASTINSQSAPVLVDEQLAEQLKKNGFVEVQYEGSADAKLMVKSQSGTAIGSTEMTLEQAQEEAYLMSQEEAGAINDVDLAARVAVKRRNGEELTKVEQRLVDSRGATFAARVEEIQNRKEEDLTQPSKEEPVALPEEGQSILDKLTSKFKGDLDLKVDVISEKEAFRRDYEASDDKAAVLAEYLAGGYIGGSYSDATKTITITSAAQIKDVVEEFAHAVIDQKFQKETSKEQKFQKAVRDIVLNDPYLRQAIAEKELDYVSRGDTSNLQEELFVEALSIIATKKGKESVLESTKRALVKVFSKFVPGFKESGADPLNVLSRLSSTLGADYLDIEGAVGQALSYPLDQEDGVIDVENADTDADAQRVMNSRRGPTFLNNKTVSFTTLNVSKYSGMSQVTSVQQKTFKDYYHFVNWYRKMTGNGQFTRIGSMSYVDQNGETKKLYPPKPLINKETGNPVVMEPAMKSYDQSAIDRNIRRAEEQKNFRRMSNQAFQAVSGVVDQIHDQIEESMKRAGRRDFPPGNTRLIVKDLMSDYKEGGTLNKENLDERGRPTREKIEGSPQYFEDLYIRVNEYMESNHPEGTPVLYSRRGVKRILDGRSTMSSSQKRKSLEYVFKKAKPYLSNMRNGQSLAKEIEEYMDRAGDDKIGPGLPSYLSRPLLNAFMISRAEYQAINPNDYTQNEADLDMMSDLVARELVDIDKELNGLPRNFFKNFYKEVSSNRVNGEIVDGVGIEIGAMSPDPVTGELSVNPEKLELSRKHKDLLIAIVGVMSNGNIALINIEEAAKFYMVVLEDVMTHDDNGPIPFTRTKARLEEINKYQSRRGSKLGRGDVITTGLERILGFKSFKGRGTPYDFNGKNVGSIHYAFKRNFLADKPRAKKGENTYEIQGQTDFGNWKKIGAFIANLYQRNDLLTQDRHFVNYVDSRFRPGISKGYDIEELFSIIEKYYGEKKLKELKGKWAIKPDNVDKVNQPIHYDRTKARNWVNKHKSKKNRFGACYGAESAIALRQFFDSDIRDKGGAEGQEFKDNIRLMELVVEKMKQIKGYSSVTVDQAMQMAFAAEHILPYAIGVQGRKYDDFSKETWEEAKQNILADGLVKAQNLTVADELAQFTLDSDIENFAIKNNLTDEQKLDIYIDKSETSEAIENARDAGDVTHYSRRGVVSLSGHPQSRAYDVSQVFKGRQASVMSNVRFSSTRFNLNKLVEGKASEIDFKAKISNIGKADDMDTVVDGVIFMRHPLYSDSFVDPYGNVIKYAEKAVMSGDMLIASGNVRFDKAPPRTPSEQIDVSAPEHFVAFQNFVSILKQRNQSLQGTNTDMFETAYKSLSAKERARFANLTVDEHGNVIKGRRLRGTSKRVASSSEYGKFKAEIINNPNNYIDRQKIADEKKALEEMSPQELVSLMRGDALNNLATRNDDVGVLAGIELINRLQAEGNDIGIVSVLDQLAAVGTTAGRVLRHMAELKTSSPQGMASVIIKKSEGQGKILSEAQKKEILDATKEYMRAYRMAEDFMERGIAGEDVENLFKRAQEDLSNAERDLDTLANKYVEKSWSEIGQQLVQGNLLTMMSQARNVVYNVANIIPKTIVDVMSMPTSKAFELLGLHKEQRKLSLAAYLYAMRKFGAGTVEAIEQVITGREKDMSEWRMSRGFMPIRSLMHAMSTDLPEGQTMRDEFNQRAKLLVQGTFGIPAEAMFRLLSLGDVPFRRFAEGLELYNLGRGKGLEGEALAQFLKFPDKDSAEQGATEGRKLTFQEPMGLARGSMWIIDNISRGMGQAFKNVKGFNGEGFFKFLIRLNVPYVSTIANFTEETLTYASPVFGGGKMAIQMGNGEYTEASKTLTKVMVGQAVSTSALYLISQGLLSGSVDWEDDEKTNLMYDTFPPNSINVSGLRRLLNGEDPSPQAGDEFRSYQTLGVFGTIMGAYAHSTTPEAAKEMAEQPFSSNNALKKLFGFDNVSVVAYMMDQSFLQGLNGITSVIASTSDPDDFERAFFRYVETISKAFSSMFLPNVLSGVDQATREFLPDKRDKDLADRIKNHVRERTFNTGGLPVKVNWKGERIEQAPVGGNQFSYYMFDATKKKEASQDEVSLNILNLYLDTGVLTKAVGTPYYASSVYRKLRPPSVSRGKAKKAYAALGTTYQFIENPQEDFFVRLTAEEINNALEMTNTLRYNDIQAFMQTEEYQGMTNNEKIEALDDINDRYKSLLSYNPDGSFMEHSKYILGIMERRYLEQYGQN